MNKKDLNLLYKILILWGAKISTFPDLVYPVGFSISRTVSVKKLEITAIWRCEDRNLSKIEKLERVLQGDNITFAALIHGESISGQFWLRTGPFPAMTMKENITP